MTAFLCSHPWLNLALSGLGLGSLIGAAFWIAVAVFATGSDANAYEQGDE